MGDVAHAHLAYVPADVALWPGFTGAEILALLAAVGPSTDLLPSSTIRVPLARVRQSGPRGRDS